MVWFAATALGHTASTAEFSNNSKVGTKQAEGSKMGRERRHAPSKGAWEAPRQRGIVVFQVYLKGFTEGVMIVDAWKGKMVKDVKPLIRQQMIDNSMALCVWCQGGAVGYVRDGIG